MTQPLFYQRVVTLDREAHRNFKLSTTVDQTFAANAPFVPLVSVEFVPAAREYPIAFLRGADQALIPVALTGLPDGRNVYLSDAGQWSAHYVPAYVRRYPFIFAETGQDQHTVCFDAACTALNEADGAPLFDPSGEPSATLQKIVQLLSDYQRQTQLTQTFVQHLQEANLLIDATAKADLSDGRSMALQGFLIVDEARFRALPEDTLKAWFASGELDLVYAHLFSLGQLLELLRRQPPKVPEQAVKPRRQTARSKA